VKTFDCSKASDCSKAFEYYKEGTYRRDIQGVRALGAVLIMIYHIWLNKVSGGVDIFFVVSGYFMATMLLRQVANEGRIRPFVFWGKIIKRVAPSAYLVIMATLVLAFLFIPETQWVSLVDEIIYSAFHVENLHLMRTSVDYLARTEPPSAVQQFWALSIQVQFYALLPLVFLAALPLVQRLKQVAPLLLVAFGLFVASLSYSVYASLHTPDSAYFNPLTRGWEFLAGVLIAVLMPRLVIGFKVRQWMALVGIVLLVTCGVVVPREAAFPGYVALIPVSAAICLLLAGSGDTVPFVNRLLCHPWLQALGAISFSVYLWHWPLLVLYLEYTGVSGVGFVPGLAIMATAIGLAVLTTRFVEQPFKKKAPVIQHPLRPYITGFLFFVPAAVTGGAIKYHFNAVIDERSVSEGHYLEHSAIEIQADASDVAYQHFLTVKSALPEPYVVDCHQHTADPEVDVCAYGDTEAEVVVALVGGSHAVQWLPALDEIGHQLNFKVLNITKSHCPFGALDGSHASCVEWNERVIDHLTKIKPAAVITNSTRSGTKDRAEYVPEPYVDQWEALAQANIQVIGIRDNPQFEFDAVHCIARNKAEPLQCAKAKAEVLLEEDPAIDVVDQLPNLRLVDMTEYLCSDDMCPTVAADMLIYRDREHLSVPYVKFLTRKLHGELSEAAPQLFGLPHRLAASEVESSS
jgi:peptidoglycan/LPS O-acetylase OafA/YrhL